MMVTKLSLLLILMSFHCSDTLVYYISPDPIDGETCTMNGNTTLRPCYSLQQLSNDKVLLSNKALVTLFLLPGKHVMAQDHDFMASCVGEFKMQPWNSNEEQEVVIECELKANFVFWDVGELEIFSLSFTTCTLRCQKTFDDIKDYYSNILIDQVKILNCVFTRNKNCSIVIDNRVKFSTLNISINNCTFSSNNRDININAYHSLPVHVEPVNIIFFITDTIFLGNLRNGKYNSLSVSKVNMTLDRCQFIHNSAVGRGGAIYSLHSDLKIYNSLFKNNSGGGAIYSVYSSLKIYHTLFRNNTAPHLGGGAIHFLSFDALVLNNTIFQDNYADTGGAGDISTNIAEIANCHFKNNSAEILGGALALQSIEPLSNRVGTIVITNSSFFHNHAPQGGAIFSGGVEYTKQLSLTGIYSQSNSASMSGGFMSLSQSNVYISDIFIANNNAEHGGAIYAEDSRLLFTDEEVPGTEINLVSNTARYHGGALFLENTRLDFYILYHVIKFVNNKVTTGQGGAIFVLDDNKCGVSLNRGCFINFSDNFYPKGIIPFVLSFINNSATYGSVLYGGLLDRCHVFNPYINRNSVIPGIDNLKNVSQFITTPNAISSDPARVCLCINDTKPKVNCNIRELYTAKMRGETVNLLVTSVDQNENPVASFIRAHYEQLSAELDKGEEVNEVYSNCSSLSYHVFAENSSEPVILVLGPEGPCEIAVFSIVTINISIESCPRGFEQNKDRCSCDRRLSKYLNITVCNIITQTIKRERTTWFRYQKQTLKMHTNCPLDYCQVISDSISLSSPDEQCANHRGGVLCGACQDNFSIALGGSKCLHCTLKYTFIWLTVVFAGAGVALVALLLVCNMTISAGTLNGLIFYANVVSISGVTNLQNCSIHPILSVFIAWVNLDLGVETCFYPGMDTYQKTWLQFAFPLYIWLLVVGIIMASYYSSTAMKIFGRNNIAILATLFLLAYNKLLKTIMTALNFTQVLESSADNVSAPIVPYRVWTYDGNIEYLKGKHVALFTVSLILLLFLFLPYTLLLIFGQFVRSMSVKRMWILRLIRSTAFISIMDAYHAPYNRRHHYWTGFMLLTRCILFLVFATSYRDSDILANTYIMTLVILGILIIKTFTTKIYKNFHMNILELCFLVNLVVLSATLYYLKGSNSSNSTICKSTNASISISLIFFFLILAYHAYLQMQKRRCYTHIIRKYHTIPVEGESAHVPVVPNNIKSQTSTVVELHEGLLESDDSMQ